MAPSSLLSLSLPPSPHISACMSSPAVCMPLDFSSAEDAFLPISPTTCTLFKQKPLQIQPGGFALLMPPQTLHPAPSNPGLLPFWTQFKSLILPLCKVVSNERVMREGGRGWLELKTLEGVSDKERGCYWGAHANQTREELCHLDAHFGKISAGHRLCSLSFPQCVCVCVVWECMCSFAPRWQAVLSQCLCLCKYVSVLWVLK